MQTDAQKQELIKVKLKELEALESSMSGNQQTAPNQPINLYEEDGAEQIPETQQQPMMEQSQQKFYDADQLAVAMWSETINNILIDCPMSQFKMERLIYMRNRLLYEMNLEELIPMPPQQHVDQPPSDDNQNYQESGENLLNDDLVEPVMKRDMSGDKDLDIISQKLKDIDQKGGLLNPEEPEPEQSGLERLLGGFGKGKKKPAERSVADEHQPMSMG